MVAKHDEFLTPSGNLQNIFVVTKLRDKTFVACLSRQAYCVFVATKRLSGENKNCGSSRQ